MHPAERGRGALMGIGALPIPALLTALAILVAWACARFAPGPGPTDGRPRAASLVLDAITVGLLAARLAYVLRWWPEYAAAPLSIVTIADGGFDVWIGLPAALLFVWWRTRASLTLRQRAFLALGIGVLVWGIAQAALLWRPNPAATLPELALVSPDARTVALHSYLGKPTVVNLWASWCPPCRREMPVLAHADATYPEVNFVLINQGEDVGIVLSYLARERHTFRHLLLDPGSRAMQALGARGLPTKLFFDAKGQLVESHMGELSAARLKDTLQKHFQRQPTATAPSP